MEADRIRMNFHQLIDSIDNVGVLTKFYALMSKSKQSASGQLWSRLSNEEQQELLLSDLESENQINLISHSEVQKKHGKWL